MKKTKIIYWVLTGILAIMMLMSGIQNAMVTKESVDLITVHLGYPAYIIPYVGVAKILAAIAIVMPGFPRIKEWAYAGIVFDLAGAVYSGLSSGDTFMMWLPMIIATIIIVGGSYVYYHKKLKTAVA